MIIIFFFIKSINKNLRFYLILLIINKNQQMKKFILVFLYLFSYTHLTFISMSQKEFNVDIDDLCYYDEGGFNNNEYVKPCEKQFYCNKDSFHNEIGICQKTSDIIKKLGEECTSSFQCDSGLECLKEKCLVQNSTEAYKKTDSVTGEAYYYCPSYLIPIFSDANNEFRCDQREPNIINRCFFLEEDDTYKIAFPDYFKVCGEQVIAETSQNSGKYNIKSTNASYIGSVEDGKFVQDERACQHGFALYFYGNNKTEKPTNEDSDKMFKRCVTVKEVDDNCNIKYSIGEKEDVYNTKKLDNSLSINCDFLIIKLELFQQYLEKMKEMEETCKNGKYYEEPFTCGNDELRKLWFFYNKPNLYLQYKNEEDIVNFFLQSSYHLYGFGENTTSNSTDYSFFLNIKYYIMLLSLLSL